MRASSLLLLSARRGRLYSKHPNYQVIKIGIKVLELIALDIDGKYA
jgi:hypothetical protein